MQCCYDSLNFGIVHLAEYSSWRCIYQNQDRSSYKTDLRWATLRSGSFTQRFFNTWSTDLCLLKMEAKESFRGILLQYDFLLTFIADHSVIGTLARLGTISSPRDFAATLHSPYSSPFSKRGLKWSENNAARRKCYSFNDLELSFSEIPRKLS